MYVALVTSATKKIRNWNFQIASHAYIHISANFSDMYQEKVVSLKFLLTQKRLFGPFFSFSFLRNSNAQFKMFESCEFIIQRCVDVIPPFQDNKGLIINVHFDPRKFVVKLDENLSIN